VENRKVKTENGESRASGGRKEILDFKDLETWKFARGPRAELYQAVATFPKEETYALVAQIRRAAISVTANLAEGYGRYSYQENLQF